LAPAISDQSAAVQRGDSLRAYDRFSKIETTWSRVDRGDGEDTRPIMSTWKNSGEDDEDLSCEPACRAKRSEERPREPEKNPCDRMFAVAFRHRGCARRRRQ
jgi:hypothetical protein